LKASNFVPQNELRGGINELQLGGGTVTLVRGKIIVL